MSEKKNISWHKWRFTMGGLYLVLLFGWIAWSLFLEKSQPWSFRIIGALFFLLFAILIFSQEWKYRKGIRVNVSSSGKEEKNKA